MVKHFLRKEISKKIDDMICTEIKKDRKLESNYKKTDYSRLRRNKGKPEIEKRKTESSEKKCKRIETT